MYLDLHRLDGEAKVHDGSGRGFRADANPNAIVHAVMDLTGRNSKLSVATIDIQTNKGNNKPQMTIVGKDQSQSHYTKQNHCIRTIGIGLQYSLPALLSGVGPSSVVGTGEYVDVLYELDAESVGVMNGTPVKEWSGIASSSGGGRTLFRGGKAGLGDRGGASSFRSEKLKIKSVILFSEFLN